MKKALVVCGGWPGHEPEKCAQVVHAMLLRHGFEVADYTLGGYHRDRFVHVPYSQIGAAHP